MVGGSARSPSAGVSVNGGTLDLHGNYVDIGALSGGGIVDNLAASGANTLTVGNGNASSTFSGILRNTSGTLALTKVGTGTINLSGTTNLGGNLAVSFGTLQMPSGAVTTPNQYINGSFTQTGGSNTVSSQLYLGYANADKGAYNLSGVGLLKAPTEYIGNGGTGNFTQTGGTNNAANGIVYLGAVYSGAMNYSGTGNYNLSGSGLLLAGDVRVGENGSGNFTQTGGSNTVSSFLYTGYNAGSSGTYNLSGSGLLSAPYEYIGYSGTGVFTQSGGTNMVAYLYLGNNTGSSGTYNLNGGLLLISGSRAVIDGAGYSTFNFNGGTLRSNAAWSSSNAMTLSGSGGNSAFDTSGGNISLSGNLSGTGALTKSGSGSLILSGLNTYSGGTIVTNGSLILENAGSLLNGSSLTIGPETAFDAVVSQSFPQPDRIAASATLAPVPEPSTFALLAVGALFLPVYRRHLCRHQGLGDR
jgi:autotransporter-associated beta strand protein